MTYSVVLTDAGAALYAAAIASSTPVVLATMAVGDGGGSPVVTPDHTRTTLVNQVYSAAINQKFIDLINPNLVWTQLVVPPTDGGFTVREIGVFTDGGVLFAIGNYPDTIKSVAAGGTTLDLVINAGMIFYNTALVTVSIDPSVVSATHAWVIATITPAYILPGGAAGQVLQKNSSTPGDFGWVNSFRYHVPILAPYGASAMTPEMVGDIPVMQAKKLSPTSTTWSMPVTSFVNVAAAVKVRIRYTSDIAAGNFYMQLRYQIFAAGSISPPSYTNTNEAIAAPSTAPYMMNHLSSAMEIPASALAVGDWVVFVLTRESTNVSDTATGNLQIIDITMEQ